MWPPLPQGPNGWIPSRSVFDASCDQEAKAPGWLSTCQPVVTCAMHTGDRGVGVSGAKCCDVAPCSGGSEPFEMHTSIAVQAGATIRTHRCRSDCQRSSRRITLRRARSHRLPPPPSAATGGARTRGGKGCKTDTAPMAPCAERKLRPKHDANEAISAPYFRVPPLD